MEPSRRLAGLIGIVAIALAVTEAFNMDIYEHQTPNVVYLNGTLLFVAGLAILRAHWVWIWRWPVLVTLSGVIALLAGLGRMAFPDAPQAPDSPVTYVGLFGLGMWGTLLVAASLRAPGFR